MGAIAGLLVLQGGCANEPDLTGPSRPTLVVVTNALPDGVVGQDYFVALRASGGDGSYSWEIADGALPGGLTLGGSSGAIAGRPTEVGTASFLVQVTSGDGQVAVGQLMLAVTP